MEGVFFFSVWVYLMEINKTNSFYSTDANVSSELTRLNGSLLLTLQSLFELNVHEKLLIGWL